MYLTVNVRGLRNQKDRPRFRGSVDDIEIYFSTLNVQTCPKVCGCINAPCVVLCCPLYDD